VFPADRRGLYDRAHVLFEAVADDVAQNRRANATLPSPEQVDHLFGEARMLMGTTLRILYLAVNRAEIASAIERPRSWEHRFRRTQARLVKTWV